MSEYVHLNGSGTYGAYGRLDEKKGDFYFGNFHKGKFIGINSLLASLIMTNTSITKMNELYPKFVELTESSLINGI